MRKGGGTGKMVDRSRLCLRTNGNISRIPAKSGEKRKSLGKNKKYREAFFMLPWDLFLDDVKKGTG